MFSITSSPIQSQIQRDYFYYEEDGAIVIFEGCVRNHHQGKSVQHLEYEIFHKLAESEANKITQETYDQFDIHKISSIHREGKLQITDIAIWIGVSASHREDAFKATQYMINEIKKRLPIWKKETYTDSSTQWVNCSCNQE